MLDMKWIAAHPEHVQETADQKGIALSIVQLVEADARKRQLQQEVDSWRCQRNVESQVIGQLMQQGKRDEAEERRMVVKSINDQLVEIEQELAEIGQVVQELMLLVPNIVSADTPIGRSDADNVEVKRVGEPRQAEFAPKDHVALSELHDIIDIPRGVKTAGTRNYYLKGAGVLLHRAMQQLAVDLLLRKGFTLLDEPLMVRAEALENTAFFPLGKDQTYAIADEDSWLVGTSEVLLVSYYANEIVDLTVPERLAAVSTCFRSEVGSAGRDVTGLYRVHQFAKVEQVICRRRPISCSTSRHGCQAV